MSKRIKKKVTKKTTPKLAEIIPESSVDDIGPLRKELVKVFGYSCILGSKTLYRELNPDNYIVYNARIISQNGIQEWKGDLDLTKSSSKLLKIAKKVKKKFYVYRESAGNSIKEAAVEFSPKGISIIDNYENLYSVSRKNQIIWNPNMVYHKKEFKYVIDLPQLDTFFTKSKKHNPLISLYQHILMAMGKDPSRTADIVPDEIFMTYDNYFEFGVFFSAYFRNVHKLIPVRARQTASMEMFNHGPNHFLKLEQPCWTRTHQIYLTKDFLKKKSNKKMDGKK